MSDLDKTKYMANVDRVRILAAFGVVSYHTHSDLSRNPGVVGFIILMMFFSIFTVSRANISNLLVVFKKKFTRLIEPWLFWSVIYGLSKLIKVVLNDVPVSETFSMTMFLTGTKIHLWFLPFAFVTSGLLAVICSKTTSMSDIRNIIIASLIGVLSIFCFSIVSSRYTLPVPFGQWMLGFPAVPLGFAIGRSLVLNKFYDRLKFYLFLIVLIAVVCVAVGSMGYGLKYAVRYCVAIVIVLPVLCLRGNIDPVSKRLATLTYGIYLIHPLVLTVLTLLHLPELHPLLLLALTIFLSAFAVVVLRKTPIKRFV
jgi:peptidoglycan/LPS O-acetylase OafA/YrhL